MPLVALDSGHFLSAPRRRLVGLVAVLAGRLIEVRKKAFDRVREGHRVGVEHDDVLSPPVHDLQRLAQGPALVSLPIRAVHDLEPRPAGPLLQDLHRLVGRVVHDDHLVLGVVELIQRLQQALDHPLLVVRSDLDRDERVIPELDVIAVPIANAVAIPVVAVGPAVDSSSGDAAQAGGMLPAVAVVPIGQATPPRQQRGEQDNHRAEVVLDCVGEEDAAQQKAGERERIRDRVAWAVDVSLREQINEPPHHRKRRQHGHDGGDQQHRVENRRPEEPVSVTRPPQCPGSDRYHNEAQAGEADTEGKVERGRPRRGRQWMDGGDPGANCHQNSASSEADCRANTSHQCGSLSPSPWSALQFQFARLTTTRPTAGRLAASLDRIELCNLGREPNESLAGRDRSLKPDPWHFESDIGGLSSKMRRKP